MNCNTTHYRANSSSVPGDPTALIYIDLDRFKELNDSHGHAAGDQLLQQVAARLSVCVRSADTLCRWGGDEFAVITEDTAPAEAALLVKRIETALQQPFFIDEVSVEVGASIGLSQFPGAAADATALVRSADEAMYRAKRLARATAEGASAQPAGGGRPAPHGGERSEAALLMTVEATAQHLVLSRPHVLKLIAEQRFNDVVRPHGAAPLIPSHEVRRVAQELRGSPASHAGRR